MGYSLTIGELEVDKNHEDGIDCSCISFGAKGEKHDNAPAFNEPTDFTNQRWPSYGVWSDCLRDAGMYDLFFCDGGHLIGGHPGVRLLTKEFYEEFTKRKIAFEAKYPHVEATYGERDTKDIFHEDLSNPKCNNVYCRIVWMDYWINWAIENCETPVFANS